MNHKNIIYFGFVLSLLTLSSCKKTNTKILEYKSEWKIDKAEIEKYKWAELTDTIQFQVYYLQFNYLNFPDDNYVGKEIIDFKDSIKTKSFLINKQLRIELLKLVSDTTNFSEGDCGTFHLNGGFIIADKDRIKATIDIGCGFNQWFFNPQNISSKYGSFNDKGFEEMERLLDKINLLKNKK